MNTLIPINSTIINHQEVNSINGRDLHTALGIKKKFADWITSQISSLNLIENEDYIVIPSKGKNSTGRPAKEYILTTDTAKGVAMASRTDKGSEVRRYFIEIEKQYHSTPAPAIESPTTEILALKDALLESKDQLLSLQSELIDTLRATSHSPQTTSHPAKRGTRWSRADDQTLLSLRSQGYTYAVIASRLDRTSVGVKDRMSTLSKSGTPTTPTYMSSLFGAGNGGER